MSRFITLILSLSLILSPVTSYAASNGMEVNATRVGEVLTLPDQSTVQIIDLDEQVELETIFGTSKVSRRLALHCSTSGDCQLIEPISDGFEVNWGRTAFVVVTIIVLRIIIVSSSSSGGSVTQTVTGGGAGPPGGGAGPGI